MAACEPVWIHDPERLRGHWRELMPDCRELRVEVGCGKGKFTVETAAAEPDVLLIAIERVPDALVLAMESAMRMELKNVFSSLWMRRTSMRSLMKAKSTCSISISATRGRAARMPSGG